MPPRTDTAHPAPASPPPASPGAQFVLPACGANVGHVPAGQMKQMLGVEAAARADEIVRQAEAAFAASAKAEREAASTKAHKIRQSEMALGYVKRTLASSPGSDSSGRRCGSSGGDPGGGTPDARKDVSVEHPASSKEFAAPQEALPNAAAAGCGNVSEPMPPNTAPPVAASHLSQDEEDASYREELILAQCHRDGLLMHGPWQEDDWQLYDCDCGCVVPAALSCWCLLSNA